MQIFSFIIIGLAALGQSDIKVVGDINLFPVIRSGIRANTTAFPFGSMLVSCLSTQAKTGELLRAEMVEIAWLEKRAYWKVILKIPVGTPPAKDTAVDPASAALGKHNTKPGIQVVEKELLYDGRQYWCLENHTRIMTIFREPDVRRYFFPQDMFDYRPESFWNRAGFSSRLWEELLGPHPNFPGAGIDHFIVTRVGVNLVDIERHDEKTGVAKFRADLEKSGHVIQSDYVGPGFNSSAAYDWTRLADGRYILRAVKETCRYPSRVGEQNVRQEWRLLQWDFTTPPPASRFTIDSLAGLAAGAMVDDKVAGRKYTIPPKEMKQHQLDQMIEKLKQERAGKAGG